MGSPRPPAISIPLCTLAAKVLTTLPVAGHCQRETGRLVVTAWVADARLDVCDVFATFVCVLVALLTVFDAAFVAGTGLLGFEVVALLLPRLSAAERSDALLEAATGSWDVVKTCPTEIV